MTGLPCALNPTQWGDTLSRAPTYCSADLLTERGALLRTWQDTSARMEQPSLTHHYLVVHHGGPKQVTRRTARIEACAVVEPDSITLVPAGTAHEWTTKGPIGFSHLYITPDAVDHVVRHDFDRDPDHVRLVDGIGLKLPLLAALVEGLEAQLTAPFQQTRLLMDSIVHHILIQLVGQCSTVQSSGTRARHVISPQRLTRILDFIESNLANELDLAELAAIAGSSRYHFSRSFREATGLPPYRFLIGRRIEAAKRALVTKPAIPIGEVALGCGFSSRRQFEAMFKRICGLSPARYRDA